MRIIPINLVNYKYTAQQQGKRPAKTVTAKQHYTAAAFMGYKPEYRNMLRNSGTASNIKTEKCFNQMKQVSGNR